MQRRHRYWAPARLSSAASCFCVPRSDVSELKRCSQRAPSYGRESGGSALASGRFSATCRLRWPSFSRRTAAGISRASFSQIAHSHLGSHSTIPSIVSWLLYSLFSARNFSSWLGLRAFTYSTYIQILCLLFCRASEGGPGCQCGVFVFMT